LVQERRRHGCRRRTIVRGVHRQSGHRSSFADRGNVDRNPSASWRNGSCRNGDCSGRRSKRCCRGSGPGTGSCTGTSTGTSASTEGCSGSGTSTRASSEGCACSGTGAYSRTGGSSERVEQSVVVASGAPSRERPRNRRGTTRRHRPRRSHHARRRAPLHRCTRADTSSCCAITRASRCSDTNTCTSTRAGCCTVTSPCTSSSTSRCAPRCYRCARRSRSVVEDSPSHWQSHDRQ